MRHKHDTGWTRLVLFQVNWDIRQWNNKASLSAANEHTFHQIHIPPLPNSSFAPSIMSAQLVSALIVGLLCINSDVMIDVTIVVGIRMQNHKCDRECFPDFQSESPCKGAHRFTSQWSQQNDFCCFRHVTNN